MLFQWVTGECHSRESELKEDQVSVACAILDCPHPVIGQCTGYGRDCRRYYCREHGEDTLCVECANLRSYFEAAEGVEALIKRRNRPVKFLGASVYLVLIGYALLSLCSSLDRAVGVFVVALAVAVGTWILRKMQETAIVQSRSKQIATRLPDFEEFYAAYRKILAKQKRDEEWQRAKAWAVPAVVTAVGAAVALEGTIRRDLEREFRR